MIVALMNDPLLILQEKVALHRDERAYKKLFLFYYPLLLRFSCGIVRKPEVAEEVVSDVMTRIWEKKAALSLIDNLRVYLYTATRNLSLKHLAKEKYGLVVELENVSVLCDIGIPSPAQILINQEWKQVLANAIKKLPPKCQMVYKLIREDGLSYSEVGQVMEISVNTVDRHLNIALHKLIDALEPYVK